MYVINNVVWLPSGCYVFECNNKNEHNINLSKKVNKREINKYVHGRLGNK